MSKTIQGLDIKQVDTRRGLRFVVTVECPKWFWDIPQSNRPTFTTVRKIFPNGKAKWELSIWGGSEEEAQQFYDDLFQGKGEFVPNRPPATKPPAKPPGRSRYEAQKPAEDVRIEFPSRGATYCKERYGVYRYEVYPGNSVLSGQQRRTFLKEFEDFAEAAKEFPNATFNGCGYQKPFVGDLPADGDPDDPDDDFDF